MVGVADFVVVGGVFGFVVGFGVVVVVVGRVVGIENVNTLLVSDG